MSWIILKQPHPLDRFWTLIHEQHETACEAHDELPDDCPDDVRAAAASARLQAVNAMLRLPARNLDDILMKLIASGIEDGEPFAGCDIRAILNEATSILDDGVARGGKLMRAQPDLLEGVML